MSRPNTPTYKTLNWPAYSETLRRHWSEPNGDTLKGRGSLTIWFDPDMVWVAQPTGKRGRQPVYSDAAVQTCLTMKVLFGIPPDRQRAFSATLGVTPIEIASEHSVFAMNPAALAAILVSLANCRKEPEKLSGRTAPNRFQNCPPARTTGLASSAPQTSLYPWRRPGHLLLRYGRPH